VVVLRISFFKESRTWERVVSVKGQNWDITVAWIEGNGEWVVEKRLGGGGRGSVAKFSETQIRISNGEEITLMVGVSKTCYEEGDSR